MDDNQIVLNSPTSARVIVGGSEFPPVIPINFDGTSHHTKDFGVVTQEKWFSTQVRFGSQMQPGSIRPADLDVTAYGDRPKKGSGRDLRHR